MPIDSESSHFESTSSGVTVADASMHRGTRRASVAARCALAAVAMLSPTLHAQRAATLPQQAPPKAPAPGGAAQPGTTPGQVVSIDDTGLVDRPIATITIKGLSRITLQAILNNIRVAAGQPFDPGVVREDVTTLYRLGQFATVTAEAVLRNDGTVEVIYTVVEQPIIREIGTVGNKVVSDEELRKVIRLYAGGPRDDFLLEQSVFRIKELYRSRGNYLVEVTVDESRLADTGILVFRIIEGPRVRIKEIDFVGNTSFSADKLYSQIKTRTAIPLFRKGELDEETLVDDVASIDEFYKGMGFVDVRVDRRVTLSADGKEAKVTYLVDEGRRYRARNTYIRFLDGEGAPVQPRVFSALQLADLAVIRPGDWYTKPLIDKTIKVFTDSYLLMGYLDVRIDSRDARVGEEPQVDLFLDIREGPRSVAGLILVQGNFLTKEKVIRRLVRIQPGRPIDGRELADSKARIEATQIFGPVRITVQRPRPGEEDAIGDDIDAQARAAMAAGDAETAMRVDRQVRDVLVEVKEKNTGAVNFGAGLGTDSGIFGEVSISQRNFDIADPPLSFDEMFTGRAFRGAGQGFSLSIAPGTEVSMYSISFAEPHLLESDLGLRVNSFYRTRIYDNYDENRLALGASLSRRLGDLWTIGVATNIQRVELLNFTPNTPLEVVESQGPANLFDVGVSLNRTDVDKPMRPTRGTEVSLGVAEHYDFAGQAAWTSVRAGASTIFTVSEDYLGRRSTLKLSSDIGYIFGDDPPTYERYYLGGRSFRGFEFRTVSPKSTGTIGAPNTPNDQPIGGEWLFFVGAQYEHPIFAEFISGVLFLDTGTVTTDVSFSEYRVSIGAGLRIYLPQLGPAPIALDFAVPLAKGYLDQTQVFSFAIELPF
ncbi:MAG: BamA/TamA family outer membrane protein [Phycisphaerales bacterium]